MGKTFKTIEELITDHVFVISVRNQIERAHKQQSCRPMPKPGYYYPRNWYNRMSEANQLSTEFFISNIASVWAKKSNLRPEVRNVIRQVCDKALIDTHEYYAAMPEPVEEEVCGPENCPKGYEDVCIKCDFMESEIVSHPGGDSHSTVEKAKCSLGYWEDNF